MTFVLRPSRIVRRLAPVLIFGAFIAGCVAEPATTGIPDIRPPARVIVVPESAVVSPGQGLQFQAYGRTVGGDSTATPIIWTASRGTISTTGLYQADASDSAVTITATSATTTRVEQSVRVRKRWLARVILSPDSALLFTGGVQQFNAYGLLSNGDSVAVTATFAATGGSVSWGGLYTAGQAAGSYNVVATDPHTGRADTSTVSVVAVPPVPVGSVTVAPSSWTMSVGDHAQFADTVKDTAGNVLGGHAVTWATDAPAVATVSPSGLVTAVAAGTANVTGTSGGKSGTGTVTVTPTAGNPGTVGDLAVATVADTSVALTFTEVTDGTGSAANYDVRFAVAPLSWSTASSVVKGTCSSPVMGSSVGARRTCAVWGLRPSTSYQFQVVAYRGTWGGNMVTGWLSNMAAAVTAASAPTPVASVQVSPAAVTVTTGQAVQLTATEKDSSGNVLTGRSVAWSSSDSLTARVGTTGVVTGMRIGTATITATSGGKSAQAPATITAPPPGPPATITVSPATKSLVLGQIVQLAATVKDSAGTVLTGQMLAWSSSDNTIASVASTGVVTALKVGASTITAASGGITGQAQVTITTPPPGPPATITVSPATKSLVLGQTTQLAATVKDSTGTALTGQTIAWSSSDNTVVSVGSTGVVTALKVGAATITAATGGIAGQAQLTITAPPNPGTVTNLTASGPTTSSVTLSFTEVDDGTGHPANYDVRYAIAPISWAVAPSVSLGTCSSPVAGTAIGSLRTCTVLGLIPSTSYNFQLVAFRGTLGVNAVLGGLSNVSAATMSSSTSQAALFSSDWSTALGNSDAALRDTGKPLPWDDIEYKGWTDFNVVSAAGLGFPAGMAHVLRHEFLTPAYAAFAHINQKWPAPAVGETMYFRVYLRVAYPNTDADRDGNAHHPIQNTAAPNLYNWHWGNNTDGTFNIQMWWDGDNSHWGPNTVPGATGTKLNKNATYRLEWALTQVAPGLFKMQVRIYDTDDVTLLYPDTDGNTRMINLSGVALQNIGGVLPGTASILQQVELGNNGWQGFSSTSYDFFGGFMVRKDTWSGPYRSGQ